MPITALPAPPSRQDPVNFAARGDEFMAALPVFVTETNDAAATVNAQQITAVSAASTATTKASEATSARDIVMAAANYKGLWTSLSGALAIPASAFHSGAVWLLKESVANVATETPGVSTKWLNVTPASGLGTAAYADETDFQAAIGALTGLLRSAGDGSISAATAAQIVAAIGSVYVANAAHASSADSADSATTIMDGTVSSAAKIANGVITWAKHAAMTTGKLIGRSTSGGGAPEEIAVGSGLSLVAGVLSSTLSLGTLLASADGYMIFSNGLILQWGDTGVGANGLASIVFPISFTTSVYFLGSKAHYSTVVSNSVDNYSLHLNGLSGFDYYRDSGVNSKWFALGK
ncbi:MAG: hypothetical protein WBK19_10580 [Azonexus sp.]